VGIHRLVSSWHLANEPSISWHRKLGFVKEPTFSVPASTIVPRKPHSGVSTSLANSHRNAVPCF
jgi:RimJ/RimL family protein N-acetyltransferase